MRQFYRIVALCLATLWLPATLCCAVEAAGWEVLCSNESCHEGEPGEVLDGCSVVEEGGYQSAVSNLKVAPPTADLCACLICLRALELGLEAQRAVVVAETTRPRDWVPIWQFERRAAAPAHAPDSLIA